VGNVINGGNAVANAAQLKILQRIESTTQGITTKLGGLLPNGGIGGILDRIATNSAVDKAIQFMTFLGVLHNAYFVSANLGQTFFSLSSSAINATLRTFGVTTANDTPIDVGAIIGNQMQNLAKQAFGVENRNEIKREWAELNRIYQAGANIISTVQSIADSTRNINEYIAENTGKIGNALKRWRVIGERAFPDMAERVTARTVRQKKLDDFIEGTSNLTDGLSALDGAFQSVISINDSVEQLGKQRQEFKDSIEQSQILERPANLATKARRDLEKAASNAGTTIQDVDTTPAEVTDGVA